MARSPGFSVYSDSLFRFRLRLLREFRKRATEFLGGKGPHPGAVVPIGRKQPLGLWRKLRAAAVPVTETSNAKPSSRSACFTMVHALE